MPEPPALPRGPPDTSLWTTCMQAETRDGWFQGCRCRWKQVFLPRPRLGWTSRSAQFSWSLQWAVWTNMWHTSRAVAPEETHTDLLWLSSLYTLISCTQEGVIRIYTRTDLGTGQSTLTTYPYYYKNDQTMHLFSLLELNKNPKQLTGLSPPRSGFGIKISWHTRVKHQQREVDS